jgi:23S rRNA pseudouridine1911/1915/1917 synthase
MGLDAATRTRVQAWIEGGRVSVNGTLVRRTSRRAAFGDLVAVVLPPGTERIRAEMSAEDVPLAILYEDAHLLILDKPAGIVVHPTHRHAAGTVMNALVWRARGWPSGSRPSIVGRLDKLTSGVVVVAKSATIHAALQRAMASSACEKDYLALVHGRVSAARGDIDLRLSHDRTDRRRIVASATTGAPSLTRFERLARNDEVSLLRCRLVTGRTHQIRVHLAARGWPIVGDPVYGDAVSAIVDSPRADDLRAFPRQALHAWRLALTHPVTRQRLTIEAPVPGDIVDLITMVNLDLPEQIVLSPAPPLPR